jgi:DNA polymerase elongation subunit (family B)/predicted RNA-binding Zn-ribbon protein involved in translation (DUF1610 family)
MKILLADIETAPNRVYAWGLFNQNISIDQIEEPGYTLCWAAKWLGEKDIKFSSIHERSKKDMLSEIYYLMDEADAIVHYNGTRFDIPTLNQEFLFMGWAPPAPSTNVDLYHTAKRRFRLPSNKLNYVARTLGLGEKTKHKGMELWRDCMAGDDKSWKIMKEYNKNDVVLLEKVYEKLLPWVPNHINHGVFSDGEAMICPNCGSKHVQKRGHYYTNTLAYQRYQCQNCGAWSRSRLNDVPKEKRAVILKGVV